MRRGNEAEPAPGVAGGGVAERAVQRGGEQDIRDGQAASHADTGHGEITDGGIHV